MLNKIKNAILGLRKFSIMIAILLVGIWFRLDNLIDGDGFVELLKVTGAAFMGSNMVEHITEAIKKKLEK